MKFFIVVGFTLFMMALLNLVYVVVEMNMKGPVYACSEVTKKDPIDVQRKCRK
jgi:hypothetical protein